MMIIRGIHRVFRVELSIRRYRARFCNGPRPLIYQTGPLPTGMVILVWDCLSVILLVERQTGIRQAGMPVPL
jgi:hypothetical protein